jgi:hypothetical protein
MSMLFIFLIYYLRFSGLSSEVGAGSYVLRLANLAAGGCKFAISNVKAPRLHRIITRDHPTD